MAHIDFKVTCWERVEIDDSQIEEVKKAIASGEITTSQSVIDLGISEEYAGTLDETDEQVRVEDNHGSPTIEVFDDNGEVVADNLPK